MRSLQHKPLRMPTKPHSEAEAYKALRFVSQFERDRLPWLDKNVVGRAIEDVRKIWQGKQVIDDVAEVLHLATRNDVEWQRGIVLYGPPGTGKTYLVELLAPRVGLTLVTPPFPGAQINGGLVGDNEKCLKELFHRYVCKC